MKTAESGALHNAAMCVITLRIEQGGRELGVFFFANMKDVALRIKVQTFEVTRLTRSGRPIHTSRLLLAVCFTRMIESTRHFQSDIHCACSRMLTLDFVIER